MDCVAVLSCSYSCSFFEDDLGRLSGQCFYKHHCSYFLDIFQIPHQSLRGFVKSISFLECFVRCHCVWKGMKRAIKTKQNCNGSKMAMERSPIPGEAKKASVGENMDNKAWTVNLMDKNDNWTVHSQEFGQKFQDAMFFCRTFPWGYDWND